MHYICALSFGLHETSKDLAREISAFTSKYNYMDSSLYAKSWLDQHLSFAHFYTSLMEVIKFDETFVSLCKLLR